MSGSLLFFVRRRLRLLLDDHTFQKFAVAFFKKGQRLAIVRVMLKGVLHKLKTGVVFVQNLAPGLHADGKIGAAID